MKSLLLLGLITLMVAVSGPAFADRTDGPPQTPLRPEVAVQAP